jgi:hypothetical protein
MIATNHDNDTAANACLSDSSYTATDSSALSLADPEKTSPPPSEKTPSPSTSSETVPANSPDNNTTNNATAITTHPNAPYAENSDPEEFPLANQLTLHPSTATTIDFPEGGLTAWLVVLGSFSAMLSLFGLINSAAVFESYFTTHQLTEKTASEIGWIFSLYLFIVFFVGIQVGPVFDRFGARVLVAVGGGLIFASLLLLSWCEGMFSIR